MARRSKKSGFSFGKLLIIGGLSYTGFTIGRRLLKKSDDTYEETEGPETVSKPVKGKPSKGKKAVRKVDSQILVAPLAMPLRSPTPHGHYGDRRPTDTSKPIDHRHQGVDLQASDNEPILAVGNGKIVPSNPGVGQLVRVLLLDDGRAVVYADMGTASAHTDDVVKAGDSIGTVMPHNPAKHTGGFVHVAIRESRYGDFVDPTGIIPYKSDTANV